jgi:4-alpha-glucanotransferase
MALGVMHDLAVGVDAGGSDAWAMPDVFAQGITVGAPPDAYNQAGQDWTQPPWRPDRLAELAYAPFRDMVRAVLRHAGGVRVDHILGLFRLWWIPEGASPTAGTYVRYDHEALVGILALEAYRAGAFVVGEDLGTVEPWVREYLAERGILGTSVLWFEYADDAGNLLPAQRWRTDCLAAVTTHDLPPTAAYLAGEHVRLRHELGVLTRPLAEELAAAEQERTAWLEELVRVGELGSVDADAEEVIAALHRYVGRAPSRLLCLALTDAVGDRRAQNQPGTLEDYPNWRFPLSGPDGSPMLLDEVLENPRAAALAEVMRAAAAGG